MKKKCNDDLPKTYEHTNDLGFRETSTVFPVLPDPEESKFQKIAKFIKKLGWKSWSFIFGLGVLIGWLILNHGAWRSVYDTYQPSLKLPELPPLIDHGDPQHNEKEIE